MNKNLAFRKSVEDRINSYKSNEALKKAAQEFNYQSNKEKYSYNFSWMGRPIIQYPQDMIAMQEIIWHVKPDLIIETGIAHGGSLIYYSSLLELIGHGQILGVDIEIREHNRSEIENHPMSHRIKMIEGSSIDPEVFETVQKFSKKYQKILVCLDSNHTHAHVLKELEMYSQLVSIGSFCVVFDTIIQDMPPKMYDRPWDVGNNPKTAVFEFLEMNKNFVVDNSIDCKLLISVNPSGYLHRIS